MAEHLEESTIFEFYYEREQGEWVSITNYGGECGAEINERSE